MLKPITVIGCILIFAAFTNKRTNNLALKNDLRFANLKGSVKSCTAIDYEIDDPKFLKVFNPKIKASKTNTFYNRQGFRTKQVFIIIGKNGDIINSSSTTYDAKLKEAKLLTEQLNAHNKISWRDTSYYIDKAGRKSKIGNINQYDKNNNLVIQYLYPDDNDIYIGKKVYKKIYRYNKHNNLIEEIDFGKKGERVSKTTYRYDSRGNELLRIDSAVMRIGNSTKFNKTTNNIYTFSSTYKNFDKAGNWLQQIIIVNNERSYSTKRIIKYY